MNHLQKRMVHLFFNVLSSIPKMHSNQYRISSIDLKILAIALIVFTLMAYAPYTFADEFKEACDKVNNFALNLTRFLGFISVAVVTVAIMFGGYQVAFAHKRFSDIAPIIIGALLIGGAAQIAKWFMAGIDKTGC